MSAFNDKTYLSDQYKNAANLNTRIELHRRFSENKYGWFTWVFDHLVLPGRSSILELGCGSGDLWRRNQDRIPTGWELTLSDFFAGMTSQARLNLSPIQQSCNFVVIDAQAIPFEDNYFSAVIADHMLYHVLDRKRAFCEIQRVLISGGRLCATSVGKRHLAEIHVLAGQFNSGLAREYNWETLGFTLENGSEQLAGWFSSVQLFRYPDHLWVTEAEPLADYILSSTRFGIDQERKQELIEFIQARINKDGGIDITKESGMFVATKA